MKKCIKCEIIKPFEEFPTDTRDDKIITLKRCKNCIDESEQRRIKLQKEYYENNKEYLKEYQKKYQKENKEYLKEYHKKYMKKYRKKTKEVL